MLECDCWHWLRETTDEVQSGFGIWTLSLVCDGLSECIHHELVESRRREKVSCDGGW